jgi:sulfopyruvate decarboxylase subunit beta
MMQRPACFERLARYVGRRDVVVTSYSSAFDWLAVKPEGLTYLAVGAMGLDTSHALGFAMAMPDRRIVTLQGDGSLMMNLGSLATLAAEAPENLIHITCRNTIYEANGGHPIPNGRRLDFSGLARASGLSQIFEFKTQQQLDDGLPAVFAARGPVFVTIDVEAGAPPALDYERLHATDIIDRFKAALRETA